MELDGSTYCRGFHGHPAFHVRSRDCMISNTGVRTCVVYLQTVQGFQEVTMTSIDLLHWFQSNGFSLTQCVHQDWNPLPRLVGVGTKNRRCQSFRLRELQVVKEEPKCQPPNESSNRSQFIFFTPLPHVRWLIGSHTQ